MRRLLLLGTLVLAGCNIFAGELTRDQAIVVARERTTLGAPMLFNAYKGSDGQRPAWIVTFRGDLEICQGDGGPPCQHRPGETVVYVDLRTGEVIGAPRATGPERARLTFRGRQTFSSRGAQWRAGDRRDAISLAS